MPKELLSGTLEEQCAFLYKLAQEKMQVGNYTGAVHALQEIVRHAPDYEDAAELLTLARARKTQQRNLLLFSLFGAAVFIGIGTFTGVSNDLLLLGLALVGLVVGYGTASVISGWRLKKRESRQNDAPHDPTTNG
jgi:hypothetical protein